MKIKEYDLFHIYSVHVSPGLTRMPLDAAAGRWAFRFLGLKAERKVENRRQPQVTAGQCHQGHSKDSPLICEEQVDAKHERIDNDRW